MNIIIHQQNLVTQQLFQDSLYLMAKRSLLEQYMEEPVDELIRKAREGVNLKDYSSLPFVDIQSANIFKDAFKYSGCKPNFIITTS